MDTKLLLATTAFYYSTYSYKMRSTITIIMSLLVAALTITPFQCCPFLEDSTNQKTSNLRSMSTNIFVFLEAYNELNIVYLS